jgi:signal transduction histidine kinase
MKQIRELGRFLRPLESTYHYAAVHLPWWHLAPVGYLMSFLLIALVVILIRFLSLKEVHFLWIPFCLVSVLVGSIWGVSPALIATLLGFLAFNFLIIPQSDLFTLDVWNDLRILGPFVLAQFGIALIAAQNAVKHRRVLVAQRELNTYAQKLTTLNQKLSQTNQELERVSHLKDDFMTRAAHELRTPLTTILGEAQLALRRLHRQENNGVELTAYARHFETIEARARGLRALIEDLLILSSLRSGEAPLRPGPCDIGKLCREVVEEQRAISGREIELRLPPDPSLLYADYERLFQVVVNLVSNAVHYSQENSVIHVCVRSKPTHVLLQVHNEGPALSQEQQARLFEPFYRTPYAEALDTRGWGLGLTVSKEIVERHGGHIRVQSCEKKGTTFFVRLPC